MSLLTGIITGLFVAWCLERISDELANRYDASVAKKITISIEIAMLIFVIIEYYVNL